MTGSARSLHAQSSYLVTLAKKRSAHSKNWITLLTVMRKSGCCRYWVQLASIKFWSLCILGKRQQRQPSSSKSKLWRMTSWQDSREMHHLEKFCSRRLRVLRTMISRICYPMALLSIMQACHVQIVLKSRSCLPTSTFRYASAEHAPCYQPSIHWLYLTLQQNYVQWPHVINRLQKRKCKFVFLLLRLITHTHSINRSGLWGAASQKSLLTVKSCTVGK